MSSRELIKNFILTEIINHHHGMNLEDTHSLVESGIIDSLGVMKLLVFLEEKFSIRLTDAELMPENFDTIQAISTLVETKTP